MTSTIKVNTVQDVDGNNIINENADTITVGAAGDTVDVPGTEVKTNKISPTSGTGLQLGDSGDTITIPSGATLANNGTATGFAAIDWQSTIVTGATHSASANQGIWIDTTSNACTVTLPASASVGDQIILTDYARTWNTYAVTIDPNGLNFQGGTTPQPQYNTNGESVHIVYSGATKGWIPIFDGEVTYETPQLYSADILVVAGGGGGYNGNSGGGGAGGLRTSTQNFNVATVYTITVGNGGPNNSSNGDVSSITGTGLTTIESAGGGGAGQGSSPGGDGGSGGGAGYNNPTGGSGNTPNTTPAQGQDGGGGQSGSPYRGGGGGGHGQAGASGPSSGNGGTGSQNSITGAATYYAGGGGAGVEHGGSAGSGGQGGGGYGTNAPGGNAQGGTANTGGGGGSTYHPSQGGSGGSGVVILSVPDADYSGTTTGTPTVTTGVSGKTIIKFTGSGSYTA